MSSNVEYYCSECGYTENKCNHVEEPTTTDARTKAVDALIVTDLEAEVGRYKTALLEVREWLEDCSESMYDAPRLKDYLDFMTMIDKALGGQR